MSKQNKSITINREQIAYIFNRWLEEYNNDPSQFEEEYNGQDYGEKCADVFLRYHAEESRPHYSVMIPVK